MSNFTKRVTFGTAMLICILFSRVAGEPVDGVCTSVDIRNNLNKMNEQLRGCVVVDGSVQIVLLEFSTPEEFANYTFPELIEITQYLVVYRAQGMVSLGKLFPNLSIIRGTRLLANAALSFLENSRLEEIGLRNLTSILEGSVVAYKNPSKYHTLHCTGFNCYVI